MMQHFLASSFYRWVRLIVTVVLALGVVVAIVFGLGIYLGRWSGPVTAAVTRVIPLPAASLGSEPLPYRRYLVHDRALIHYKQAAQQQTPGLFASVRPVDTSAEALDKLIKDAATLAVLRQLGLSLNRADVDQTYTAQILQGGSAEEATAAIRRLYEWTPAEFKDNVLRIVVAREKIREKLSFDETLNRTARLQAERVYALVKAGDKPFDELAKAYSQDAYAANGGDLGFVVRGEQLKEIDDAAFALEVGQVSDIIHTKYGFHILKVEEKKTANGQDQIRLRQIFTAAPSVDERINAAIDALGPGVFLPGVRWDAKKHQVVPR